MQKNLSIDRQFNQIRQRDKIIIRQLWMLAVVLGAIILVLAVMLLVTTKAQALECRGSPQSGTYWSWRQIDGKRCWYQGRHVLPKSQLHWILPEADGNGNRMRKPPVQTDKLQPVGNNADYNYIDAHADDPMPLVDLDEARPFGPWEERVSGQFAGAVNR